MTHPTHRPWGGLICLMAFLGLAFTVQAQGQSPDSPRPRPQAESAVGLTSQQQQQILQREQQERQQRQQEQRQQQQQQQQQGQGAGASQATPPGPRGSEASRPAPPSRERRREAAESAPTQEGGGAEAAESGRERAEAEREVAGGGARSVGGAARSGGSRPTGGAGGGRFGSNYSVSSTGTGTFEPILLRDIEYGEVPDEGEALTFLDGQLPLQEFLSAINLATNWNIIVSESVKAVNLNFWINEVRPKAALEILKFHKVFYTFQEEGQYLYVMTEEEWLQREFGKLDYHEFVVKNAEVSYIESILSSLLSAQGRIITDQRTGRIYVWDTQDNLEFMIKTIDELDVPLQKITLTVQHAELGDIESVLNSLMTPNGSLLSDPRTGQIFLWDAPAALERMQGAVKQLDVPLETRRFDIAHVNAENILDAVESLLSERGLIQVDPRFNALMITDLPRKLDRMGDVIENLDRPLETRTWVINYADLDFIADQIETHIPSDMGEVVVNDAAYQITATGLPERLDKIDQLIGVWDIRRRQVLIEAFIVEVGADVERQFNINWSYFGMAGMAPISVQGGQGFGSGNSASVGQLPYNIPAFGDLQLDGSGNITRPQLTNIDGNPVVGDVRGNPVGVTLDYLDKMDKVSVLSSPRVTVQDGEEAIFENARRVPFVSSTTFFNQGINTGGFGANNTNRVEFIDVGTILTVTPRITQEDNILMDISAEDSDATQVVITSSGEDSTVPEKTTRRAETQLRVHSGETVVMGGLRKDRSQDVTSKTPILGDLPLLGRIFRYPNKKSANRSLLIFITPTIVDERTYPEADFLARAESKISDDHRHNLKTIWGRWSDKVSQGRNEISVSIGQTGGIHSEGERLTLEELHEAFFKVRPQGRATVVVRRHPSAPEEVVAMVTEAAMEAGMRVEFDERMVPLVASPAPRAPDGTPLAVMDGAVAAEVEVD